MNKSFYLFISSVLILSQTINAQILDTITICNGDSVFLYSTWETETGNYTNGFNVTTLIVNPTPSLTGNFILNGSATQPIPDTYDLTQAINTQSGSAWNSVTLDLNQPFNVDVDVYLGILDPSGADGLAFVLQQQNTAILSSGGGIGYGANGGAPGISPSFAVEFDTWDNGAGLGEPFYDHIAIQKDGDLNHLGANNILSPIGFPPANANIEDGLWHNVIFSWDPVTFNFQVIYDGTLLVNINYDMVSLIFGNDPSVFWGFTAATGGAVNLQRFRINSLDIELSDSTICDSDTIQINPQVNTGAFSYLWTPNYNISDNEFSSPYFSPDTTTTYLLEVTNMYGCTSSDSFTLFVNPSPSLTTSIDSVTCYGYNDGEIDIISNGILGVVNYLWSGPNSFISNNEDISLLYSGIYSVVATSSAECSVSEDFFIYEPPTIDTSFTVVDVSCNGGSDGYIAIEVLSPILYPTQYSYFIDGVLNLNPPPYDTAFSNLSQGSYQISILDNLTNCLTNKTIYIDAPNFPLQVLSSNDVIICDTSLGGSAYAYAAGGSPFLDSIYVFEWYNSNWGSIGVGDTISGLGIGDYFLEVTDSNGCQADIPITVSTSQLPLSLSPQLFGVVCTGDSTGSAVVFAGGGSAPYDYEWSDLNDSVLAISNNILTRDTLTGLIAGSYHLVITDTAGCTEEMVFNIDEPLIRLEILDVLVVDSIDCYGELDGRGIVDVVNGSGSPTYSYLWDNGETTDEALYLSGGWHTVEVSDTRGCVVVDSVYIPENSLIKSVLSITNPISCYGDNDGVISVSDSTEGGVPFLSSPYYEYFWSNGVITLDTINNLFHGSYYLTTRDALGCVVVDSIYLSEPDPLYINAEEVLRVSCYGDSTGSAFAVGVGGTPPYTFTWQDNNIVTTSNDSSIINTLLFSVLETVQLEDARGCIAEDTVMITQPENLVVSISDSVLAYCIGVSTASASAVVVGGTAPYTYEWNDNNIVPQTTITASNLDAGTYMVTVEDSRGCLSSVSVDLDSVTTVMNAAMHILGALDTSVSCYGGNDGSLTVQVTSGTFPYTYQWIGPTGVSTNDSIFNLTAGIYSVTVTDDNGCVVNTSQQLTAPAPLLYKVISTNNTSCLGSCDGVLGLYIEGGVSSYTAELLNNQSGLVTSYSINGDTLVTGVCTGDYTVTIEDSHDCDGVLIFGGSDQAVLDTTITTDVVVSQQAISCYGDSTGIVSVVNPLAFPYSYSWQDVNGNVVGIAATVGNLPAGDYMLYAGYNSINGCTTVETITVSQSSLIHSSAIVTNASCNGSNDGSVVTTTFGGAGGYTYSWSPSGFTDNDLMTLVEGVYELTITDTNNCTVNETYTITEPALLVATVGASQTYILSAIVVGGTSPYSYSWVEQTQPSVELGILASYTVGANGTYYVMVTDANDCESASNSTTYEETPSAITDLNKEIHLSVYPNPFRRETTVDFGQTINKATITIVDIYGKLIEIHELINTDKYIIKRTNKASGVYFMEIEIDKANIKSKIIIK